MADVMWADLVSTLVESGVEFETGLTDTEIEATEVLYGFRFPPDLRAFLHAGLPHGSNFPNWRDDDEGALREWLDLPRRGILFDIEHNGFWLNEWGPQPHTLGDARESQANW